MQHPDPSMPSRPLAPSHRLSLGRVSVLRGEGAQVGLPCIDDYVRAVEPIVDHLTRYRCDRAVAGVTGLHRRDQAVQVPGGCGAGHAPGHTRPHRCYIV
jgi:hypothetical protein